MEKEKKVTIAERVLRFIGESRTGRRAKEIHVFAFKCSNPDLPETHRSAKSWWGTNLYYGSMGLLENFCMKTEDGRWVLTEEVKGPFFSLKRPKTETYKLNVAKREHARRLQRAVAVKCRHCGDPNIWDDKHYFTPDGQAHFVLWGRGYTIDCQRRVWAGGWKEADKKLTTLTEEQVDKFTRSIRYQVGSWDVERAVIETFVNGNIIREGA